MYIVYILSVNNTWRSNYTTCSILCSGEHSLEAVRRTGVSGGSLFLPGTVPPVNFSNSNPPPPVGTVLYLRSNSSIATRFVPFCHAADCIQEDLVTDFYYHEYGGRGGYNDDSFSRWNSDETRLTKYWWRSPFVRHMHAPLQIRCKTCQLQSSILRHACIAGDNHHILCNRSAAITLRHGRLRWLAQKSAERYGSMLTILQLITSMEMLIECTPCVWEARPTKSWHET